jgi:ABC-2 type transport system permease protein
VLAASLFQSAAAGMISIVEDRENDFSCELFVAPVCRLTLVGGKIAGETLVALCQGACIVVFALVFGVRMSPSQLALLLGAGLACCLLGGAFGLATIAVLPNQRSAMQIFQFLIIPQYVLGGVLVPLRDVPPYLRVLAHAMPMTYVVNLTRAAYYAGTPAYRLVASGSPLLDVAVTAILFVVMLTVGRDGVRLPGANPLIRSIPGRAQRPAGNWGHRHDCAAASTPPPRTSTRPERRRVPQPSAWTGCSS